MDVKWGSLGVVAVVGVGVTVGVVLMFALGVRALAGRDAARDGSPARTAQAGIAGMCFAACAGAVLYGLYVIIPQFH